MPDTIDIKGQFSVPPSSPDAFGLPIPRGVFIGGVGQRAVSGSPDSAPTHKAA